MSTEAAEFSHDKTHHQNIQVSINKILGQPTSLKKVRKSRTDHARITFCKMIMHIERINERAFVLDEQMDMDMAKYDNLFFRTIDLLLELHFNPNQVRMINFYLYDRYNEDGTITPLMDETENFIKLDTADELYSFIINIK